jgi:hypothetical protein
VWGGITYNQLNSVDLNYYVLLASVVVLCSLYLFELNNELKLKIKIERLLCKGGTYIVLK